MTTGICPICRKNSLYKDETMNAVSVKDNKTMICLECALDEAVDEFQEKIKHNVLGGNDDGLY